MSELPIAFRALSLELPHRSLLRSSYLRPAGSCFACAWRGWAWIHSTAFGCYILFRWAAFDYYNVLRLAASLCFVRLRWAAESRSRAQWLASRGTCCCSSPRSSPLYFSRHLPRSCLGRHGRQKEVGLRCSRRRLCRAIRPGTTPVCTLGSFATFARRQRSASRPRFSASAVPQASPAAACSGCCCSVSCSASGKRSFWTTASRVGPHSPCESRVPAPSAWRHARAPKILCGTVDRGNP